MDESLAELQRKVGATRRRLEDAARRLAALRDRLTKRGDPQAATTTAEPLFQGLGGQDVELHFEALDTEDPEREKR